MEEKALVTIIVPIYNGERYISECVESVLQQDYTNLEIILVDDGSTDNSAKIAEGFSIRDNRVKVIHQKNAGVSVARNAALDESHGEYICFVDQDDYLLSDYVSYFYNLLLKNNAEIALSPQVKKFTESTKQDIPEENAEWVEIWSGKKAAAQMLYYNLIIAPWNKMISRDLIIQNNLRFDSRYFSGEGFSFSVDCFQRAKRVAVGHRKVYCYRLDNPDSGMTKFSMHVINSSIGAQKTIRANLVERTPELLRACRYANWHTHCDCLNTMVGCRVMKQYPEKYKTIKGVCQREALCALKAPIAMKEKIKGVLYFINPFLAAKFINRFRLRKFTKES